MIAMNFCAGILIVVILLSARPLTEGEVEVKGEKNETRHFAEAATALQFKVGEQAFVGNQAPAGWRFSIVVPQPNGGEQHHVWVQSFPDEKEAREKIASHGISR
jgi:hypothetical protein